MKYIRTKDGVYRNASNDNEIIIICRDRKAEVNPIDIIAQADTIEELCDERVLSHYFKETNYTNYKVLPIHQWDIMANSVSLRLKEKITDINYLGAIWTDKGLIYVAKMNNKGELELL